jgi:formate/nitrite transporter FocA (FNT family)
VPRPTSTRASATKEHHQQSAAPTSQKDLARPSAEEIFEQVASNARQELQRPSLALGLSGFGAGVFIGLSALGPAIILAALGTSPAVQIVARMFYPIGFIIVILGRAQLFTENTLYPVALVLAEKHELWNTLRLWAVVLPSNIAGAFAFALLATRTSALTPGVINALSQLGANALAHTAGQVFWSGVFAGWIIALTAWLVSGSHSNTGSVMVIWSLMFLVGLGNFAHCVATTCEIFISVLDHGASLRSFPGWFLPALSGNICGGVGLVTILEYGQVMHDHGDDFGAKERRSQKV